MTAASAMTGVPSAPKATGAVLAIRHRPAAASGAWTSEDTYTIKLCYSETPFCSLLTFRFEPERLTFDVVDNVSFGPLEPIAWGASIPNGARVEIADVYGDGSMCLVVVAPSAAGSHAFHTLRLSTSPGARQIEAVTHPLGAVSAIVLLLLMVAAQAAYHFRDSLVAFWPVTRPAFERLCEIASCAIRPLRDAAMSHLSIESSDLQADAAHKGLLILTATVRNRASLPLAYPSLELTLTDAQDQVVVRRVLAPTDYAGGTTDLSRGIPAHGEISIKVFIDASATSQAGYRLYMFYP